MILYRFDMILYGFGKKMENVFGNFWLLLYNRWYFSHRSMNIHIQKMNCASTSHTPNTLQAQEENIHEYKTETVTKTCLRYKLSCKLMGDINTVGNVLTWAWQSTCPRVGLVWGVSGQCLGNVWPSNGFWVELGVVWKVSGKCLALEPKIQSSLESHGSTPAR